MATLTVTAHDDPQDTWNTVVKAGLASGVGWLSAGRLASAVVELVGTPAEAATVVMVAHENGVQATLRGGAGHPGDLPAGLTDICLETAGETGGAEQVVVVIDKGSNQPADPATAPLLAAIADTADPRRLTAAALGAVARQASVIAAKDAYIHEFQGELDETNRGLLAVHAELQAANQRVADLVAMLSHDIRQPLAVISAFCELLLGDADEIDPAELRSSLLHIRTASVGMTLLVEEILTLTQLDSATLGARPASLNLADVVRDAIGSLMVEPGTIRTGVQPGDGVRADPRHLHQILTNLFSNALKYGTPPIDVTCDRAEDLVRISVRDHGVGVPAEFAPRLFERFARADTPATRAKKGTGMGLYIVRQLVEANGGVITYRTLPTGGACFTVQLPAAP